MPIQLHIVSGCLHITKQSQVTATESCALQNLKYLLCDPLHSLLAPVLEADKRWGS